MGMVEGLQLTVLFVAWVLVATALHPIHSLLAVIWVGLGIALFLLYCLHLVWTLNRLVNESEDVNWRLP